MKEVNAHPQRVILPEHPRQLRGDPLRKNGWHLGADPDELDMRDRPESTEDPVEFVLAQRQRVAAGNQDVADLGRSPQIVEGHFQAFFSFAMISPCPTTRDRVQ